MEFEDAFEIALESGVDNSAYRRLNRFRQWIAEADTAESLRDAEGQDAEKIEYELEKIRTKSLPSEDAGPLLGGASVSHPRLA